VTASTRAEGGIGLAELIGYLAPEGFLPELVAELGDAVREVHGRLVLATSDAPVAWAANVWHGPVRIPISSIGDAAKKLRVIQRNWALYSCAQHRRAALIMDKLPKVSAKPLAFGTSAPAAPLGSWTLLDKDTLLAAPHCASPFPNGEVQFIEDRAAPPSRAYLKLWELFTRLGTHPRPGEVCVDLGASPGGWTWVLAQLSARVISVDKAALEPRIASLPGVAFQRASAFALDPREIGPVDWLFSDVVCYPNRLLGLVEKWRAAGTVRRFVCTIKFQGATDFASMQKFAAIPGSELLHLHHNKHELTWIKL
jgi:23S rRNA (cytidine2498-2'-O)-methyltransferase